MNFLNPLVLIGLAAAAIPVLLHLLNLRKLRKVEFSSLKFLKELQKTKIRKLKLKQILLLILRTLLIIFAVIAFARPTIPGSLPFFGSYAQTSAVVLLDNSFSMDISDEYGNRFNQAKSAVLNIIENLKDGDEVAVIPMASERNEQNIFTRNFDFASENLNFINISKTPANLNRSMRMAESLIDDALNLNKEIYIISDYQTNIFNIINNDTFRLQSPVSSLIAVPVGNNSNADLQNISIDSVKLVSGIFQYDKLVEIEAFVRNNSKNTIKDVVITMKYNGKAVAQRSADIASGETKSFLIAAKPQDYGQNKASIELEGDIQDLDNYRYLGFNIPPKPKILVAGSQESELFLNAALNPFKENDISQNIKFVKSGQLSGENFIDYNTVIVAGINLSDNDLFRLNQYVNSGGSLLIFANIETEFEKFSKFLEQTGIGKISDRKFNPIEPASFTNVDKNHQMFEGVFDDKPGTNQIESPKIIRAYPAESGLAVISIPGGAFLSESKKGQGKVIYIAVDAENRMSNLPVTGLFPALIYRSILYLSQTEDKSSDLFIGESLRFSIPARFAGSNNFKISDPSGNDFYTDAIELPQGRVISIENLRFPGIYTIFDESDNYVSQIAVNTDPTESNMNQNGNDIIKKELSDRFIDGNISIIDNVSDLSSGIQRVRTGTELWQIFVILALICAITEMIVQKVSKNEVAEA